MGRGIGGENTDLAVVHLTDAPTVLLGNTDGVIPFFDETGFIKNHDAIGISKVIVYHTMMLTQNLVIVPDDVTDKMLHRPDIAVFYGKSDWLNGFSLQFAELTDHILEKMVSGFAAGKTVSKNIKRN